MSDFAFSRERQAVRCPNCSLREITLKVTKSVPGKHYHCDKCGHEWQDRVVRRYRERKNFYNLLFKMILERSDQLDSQDRFFVEKLLEKGNYTLKTRARLLRIAHKTRIDPRELY
jgi:transcription elongation factor Elf1